MTKTNLLPDEIEVYHDKFGDLLAFKEFDLRVPGTRYVRADLVSTTNKPAEVDLDDVQGDTPSSQIGGCDYMSFKDASKLFGNYIDYEMRDPSGLNDVAKAMLSYERMIRHLATGKGGGAAPTQIDAGDLELALSSLEPDDVDKAVIYAAARAHLSKLSGGDAPQSDMVAVPREVIEGVRETLKAFTTFSPNASKRQVAKEALSMLQPYTKGDGEL